MSLFCRCPFQTTYCPFHKIMLPEVFILPLPLWIYFSTWPFWICMWVFFFFFLSESVIILKLLRHSFSWLTHSNTRLLKSVVCWPVLKELVVSVHFLVDMCLLPYLSACQNKNEWFSENSSAENFSWELFCSLLFLSFFSFSVAAVVGRLGQRTETFIAFWRWWWSVLP